MKRLFSGSLLFAIYVGMLAPFAGTSGQINRLREDRMNNFPDGFRFRLSEGVEGAGARQKSPVTAADPISDVEAGNLLKRIPEIKAEGADQTDLALRAGTVPAPKTGKRVPIKFPADGNRGTPKIDPGSPLDVIRFSPEGEVGLAPDLNVTFSQPMVAVSSQEQAAQFAPVEITPQVEGRWRWLGTKTLMFDTDKRFPMATKFTARVAAGTRSVNGQTLARDFAWTFTTPPPKVEQMYPQNEVVRRDSLIFASFDQAIDPEAVVRSISVTGQGRKIPVRLASNEEIAASAEITSFVKQAQPGRWIVFRAIGADGSTTNALPGASAIVVTVEKGTPSAEGPLVTQAGQKFQFTTYGPFKYSRGYCGWPQNPKCTPFTDWHLEFNNPIDGSTFTKDMVKIDPPIDDLNIYPSGKYLAIQGYKKGQTTYKITVDATLKDTFGQTLDQKVSATINVGSADQSLYAQGGTMAILDPTADPTFSVYSTNYSAFKVRLYAVQAEDWDAFRVYMQRINYDDATPRPAVPGKIVSDKVVTINNKPDELVETRIDISPALDGGFGNVIVDVEPVARRDKYDRSRVFTWLQATQIGLDAFVDNSELVGFATELKTGAPLAGVQLAIYPNGGATGASQISENDKGMLESAWDLVTGWGSNYSGDVESVDANGEHMSTDSVGAAVANQTGPNGVLRLPLPESLPHGKQNLLIARRGKDVAFLPENGEYYWQDTGNWFKRPDNDQLRWFVFDDRQIYRPNDEVSVKGYIRKVTGGKLGDVEGLADAASGLTWSVKDPRNNEIAKGTGNLNAFGAFNFKFKLPDNSNLGAARIDLATNSLLAGTSFAHPFQIQEFRRPEFEVSTKGETQAPHMVGESTMVSVEAKYYSGGPLAGAETNWTVSATPTNYTPPDRSDFTFGTWTPWWRGYDYGVDGRPHGETTTQQFKGVTDAGGKHVLKIDFDSVKPPRPYSLTASAAVQDVNRQTWSSSTSLLVHPSSLYVGIRTARTFVQKGENINVESIVTDIDGKLILGRDVDIKAVLKDWTFEKGSWQEITVDEQKCILNSGDTAKDCKFVAKKGGRYTITATVMDDRERLNQSEIIVWVPGGKVPPKRSVEQEEAQIIPSKKDFAPGDTAELLVITPFTPAEGILTLRRDGIVRTERFTMKDSSITLKVPINERYLPNIYAQVDLVGSAPRQNDKGELETKLASRPAFASGNINLPISTASRKLTVSAEPAAKTLAPGAETKVNVDVKDVNGQPVAGAEVAAVIVDESILALTGYDIADPASIFYTARSTGTQDFHSRSDVLLANPDDIKKQPPAPMEAADAAVAGVRTTAKRLSLPMAGRSAKVMVESENSPAGNAAIQLRQNFNALAVFAPSVTTDANGVAIVDVKLPDNLTRYRVTAVAVDRGKRFGRDESTITAKQPLMVRPSAPRFMNFGDKMELPVVVQNQTDKDMSVDVAVRATNALLTGDKGKRVVVRANDRAEVRFPVSADSAGTARFQIAANSGAYSDAAEISLPVWTPATSEAFATYGTTDENGAVLQPVQPPSDVYPQFGGVEVTTSSTQLQELTDAFIYLYRYPFECSEQVASRMISIAALRDVLRAFKAKEMPSEAEINASFEKDIKILQSRQREDGSFGLWKRDRERYEYPFLTVHVTHALALARSKGYKVPDEMLAKSKPYLRDVESHFDEWHKNSPEIRWTISAYALYVRDLEGDRDAAKAKSLLAEATVEKMPFEALGWVLSVLAGDPGSAPEVTMIERFLMNHTTETAAAANFVTHYGDAQWLIMYSNRRADGVLLEALIKSDPKNDLIPKLVRGLLDHRTEGRWSSTQENVFILLALDKYFDAFEKVTPDFVGRIWLGNAYGGEQQFRGRSVDSNLLNIPMSYLMDQGGGTNLIIDKQGAGRLYYRIGMKYAPKNLKLDPADYGFTVLRKYEAVDNPEDVRQNPDGSWTVKSGSRVRVRLTMVAQARRYHVALVDNLPAGFEILNPGLAVTEAVPTDRGDSSTKVLTYGSRSFGQGSWWRHYWFEHQNFRDERAEAFASLLWEGVYNYTYVARATTPGQFVVPPTKAEEMYHPETFGRTSTDFLRVE